MSFKLPVNKTAILHVVAFVVFLPVSDAEKLKKSRH